MYVRWKVLFFFGIAFWMLNCVTDYFRTFSEPEIVSEPEEFKIYTGFHEYQEHDFSEESNAESTLLKVIFLGLTFSLIAVGTKVGFQRIFLKFRSSYLQIADIPSRLSRSLSKIPLKVANADFRQDELGRGFLRQSEKDLINESGRDLMKESGRHLKNAYGRDLMNESGKDLKKCSKKKSNSQERDLKKSSRHFSKEESERESDLPAPASSHSDSDSKPKKLEKKKSRSSRLLEKHCAKLRDEILVLRTTSSQEHVCLSKKIDQIKKEKRSLMSQLVTAQKENRAAKQQLEEILSERSQLVKRLECATKEIKLNTKSKKATLVRLEEALGNMEKLQQNCDQVNRDKEILEDKLRILEREYNQLKEQQFYLYSGRAQNNVVQDLKEHAVDRNECGDHLEELPSLDQIDDFDISQSEKDMKKVQEKLMNLEKSLEKLKLRDSRQSSDMMLDSNWQSSNMIHECLLEEEHALIEKPSAESICTEPECPLEHQECSKPECLLRYRNNCDSSPFEEDVESNGHILRQSYSEPFDVRDPQFSNLEVMNYINSHRLFQHQRSSEDLEDRLSIISEGTNQSEVTSPSFMEDEQEEIEDLEEVMEWNPSKHRIVSNSPAFLEFLTKVLETPI